MVLILILGYIMLEFFRKLFSKQRKRTKQKKKRFYLSSEVRSKADWKYQKLLRKFKLRNKREPINREKFWIIVNASHITIRRKGFRGHWGRQKVRKYLLEKHGIRKNYIMR